MPSLRLARMATAAALSAALAHSEVELSLADLMNLKIESVSKRSESLLSAPTAVYVVTADDLRKFGVTRLVDALQMVPGVVSTDKNYFSPDFIIREDRVPVPTTVTFLIDGVPLQNPLFGAVFFRGLELPIDQIDRIEVIRGNGGTIYGANAVTGVVSIFTKKPRDVQGWLVHGNVGLPGHGSATVRYGGTLGARTAVSAYGSAGYSRGYDADGDTYRGDSVWAQGFNRARTADSTYRIANKFTDEAVGRPVLWNGMLAFQTDWSDDLSTMLRFWGRGMEDRAYVRKSYPWLTLQQAQAQAVPQVMSRFVTNPADLPEAIRLLAMHPQDSLPMFLMSRGYDVAAFAQNFEPQMTAAMTALLTTAPADSVFSTEVHFRSFTGNLRADWKPSENHTVFINLNGVYNVNRYSDYAAALVSPNNWSAEIEAQDILGFDVTENARFEWITGANARFVQVDIGTSYPADALRFIEPQAREWLRAGFIQAKLGLWDKFDLIGGLKGEQWTLAGDDIQWMPSARAVYHPSDRFAAWTSATRGVTVPGYVQMRMESRPMALPAFDPTGSIPAQALGKWVAGTFAEGKTSPVDYRSYEGGVRSQVSDRVFIDIAGYYQAAEGRILSTKPDMTRPVPSHFDAGDSVVATFFGNTQNTTMWGLEPIVRLQPWNPVHLELGYSYQHTRIDEDKVDAANEGVSRTNPLHVAKVRGSFDLPARITVSAFAQWMSSYRFAQQTYDYVAQVRDAAEISPNNIFIGKRESLFRLDLTLEKRWNDRLSMQVYGKNLTAQTPRYEDFDFPGAYPEKTGPIYGAGVRWEM